MIAYNKLTGFTTFFYKNWENEILERYVFLRFNSKRGFLQAFFSRHWGPAVQSSVSKTKLPSANVGIIFKEQD